MRGRTDWYQVLRLLCHGKPRIPPHVAWREMTFPEIQVALDADLEKPSPAGGGALAPEEIPGYAAWWRALTPRQKMEASRAGSVSAWREAAGRD